MSSDASVELDWGDGEKRKYRLGYGEIEELQERCTRPNAKKDGGALIPGPILLYRLIAEGEWLVGDISHTIRLGAIGGGMLPRDANVFVNRYIFKDPVHDSEAAAKILRAWLEGAKDDPLPKPKAAEMTETMMAPAASSSAVSTESVQPSASRPKKSKRARRSNSRRPSPAGTNATARETRAGKQSL